MKIIGIEHIGIAVNDLNTSSSFWENILNIVHTHTEDVESEGVSTKIFDTGKGKIELLDSLDKNNYIIDAGLKALSTDSNFLPIPSGKLPSGSKYSFMGDEHGKITIPKNSKKILSLGDKVFIQPSHCDPTVNLYNNCKIITNNKIIDTWKIDARGYI